VLTLFTIPKPFSGAAAIAQDNAIESWQRVAPDVEILLFGDEAGIAEAAVRHGVGHVAQIRRNEHGTPLLDDAFATAQARAQGCFAYPELTIEYEAEGKDIRGLLTFIR